MSCPDWTRLARQRRSKEGTAPEAELAWSVALAHAEDCERCRLEAQEADPLVLFQDLDMPELDEEAEVASMQQAVAAMRRARSIEGSSADRKVATRSYLTQLRAAAVATAVVGAAFWLWGRAEVSAPGPLGEAGVVGSISSEPSSTGSEPADPAIADPTVVDTTSGGSAQAAAQPATVVPVDRAAAGRAAEGQTAETQANQRPPSAQMAVAPSQDAAGAETPNPDKSRRAAPPAWMIQEAAAGRSGEVPRKRFRIEIHLLRGLADGHEAPADGASHEMPELLAGVSQHLRFEGYQELARAELAGLAGEQLSGSLGDGRKVSFRLDASQEGRLLLGDFSILQLADDGGDAGQQGETANTAQQLISIHLPLVLDHPLVLGLAESHPKNAEGATSPGEALVVAVLGREVPSEAG